MIDYIDINCGYDDHTTTRRVPWDRFKEYSRTDERETINDLIVIDGDEVPGEGDVFLDMTESNEGLAMAEFWSNVDEHYTDQTGTQMDVIGDQCHSLSEKKS